MGADRLDGSHGGGLQMDRAGSGARKRQRSKLKGIGWCRKQRVAAIVLNSEREPERKGYRSEGQPSQSGIGCTS